MELRNLSADFKIGRLFWIFWVHQQKGNTEDEGRKGDVVEGKSERFKV